MLASCCVETANHQCDPVLVRGENLHILMRCIFVESGIWKHFDGPLDTEIISFCRDDLVSHLGTWTDRDHLEELLSRLPELWNLQMEVDAVEEVRDDPVCLSPTALEFGPGGDPFRDSSDAEPFLPKMTKAEVSESTFKLKYEYDSNPFEDSCDIQPITLSHPQDDLEPEASRDSSEDISSVGICLPQKQAKVGARLFRSHLPSISLDTKLRFLRKFTAEKRPFRFRLPSVSLEKHLRLRRDYQRLPPPSQNPVCPRSGECSTCETCKEATEYEW